LADFEGAVCAASGFAVPDVVDSVLTLAADANFLGFGAGAGGRLLMAVGETAKHINKH